MKKRDLLGIILVLSLFSFNYSIAYFSNELLLEDNIISIGEFDVVEDEIDDEVLENTDGEISAEEEGQIDEEISAEEGAKIDEEISTDEEDTIHEDDLNNKSNNETITQVEQNNEIEQNNEVEQNNILSK